MIQVSVVDSLRPDSRPKSLRLSFSNIASNDDDGETLMDFSSIVAHLRRRPCTIAGYFQCLQKVFVASTRT
jgi:hypothetical protein